MNETDPVQEFLKLKLEAIEQRLDNAFSQIEDLYEYIKILKQKIYEENN